MLQGGVFAPNRCFLVILSQGIDTIQTMCEPGIDSVMILGDVISPSADLADDHLHRITNMEGLGLDAFDPRAAASPNRSLPEIMRILAPC